MAATQQVIIEFIGDFSDIKSGTQELVKMGKVDQQLGEQFKKTNTEIKKQGDAFEKAAQSGDKESNTLKKLKDLMAQFPKTGLQRFLLQVGNELTGAGVKAEEFKKKLDPKDTTPKIATLRQELKLVKEQMQQAAIASGVLSEEYKKLKERAGQLDDTIKDVNDDIANAGSDTRGIDNVVGSISALAGGYSAVQGAAALFGDESEELQKSLLRVNAAMALATGIQQLLNATTKQGALARVADAAATNLQIAAQRIYTFVTGRATAATVAFKIALAATGIGLVILAVVALTQAFKSSTRELEKATTAVDRHNAALESMNQLLDQQLNKELARAQAAGKSEADLLRIRGQGIIKQIEFLAESTKGLIVLRDQLNQTSEAWHKLNDQIDANADTRKELDNQLIITSLNLEAQAIEDVRKALDERERVALAGARNDLQRFNIQQSFDRQRLADLRAQGGDIAKIRQKENDIFIRAKEREIQIAKKQRVAFLEIQRGEIEARLVNVQEGSIEEFDLRKKLLDEEMKAALEAENLTSNERKAIIQDYLIKKLELEKAFNKRSLAQAAEDEKSRISAQLANLNLREEEKLQLTIDFLRISADAEIQAAEGNAARIREINAKLNADIAAVKVASIKKVAEEEARFIAATGGPARRALERVAENEKFTFTARVNAIRQLSRIQTDAIDKEIEANRAAIKIKGADQRALELEYIELLDRRAAAAEETELRITNFTKAQSLERIRVGVAALEQLGQIAASIQQNQQQAAQNSIELQKREVDDLLKAGAISEQEAERRNKKIEAEERAAKNRAARQIKALAVFQALLAIPQAYLAGLQTPVIGAIVGPVYAALAAVQAGLVAARPVPKFATGKKGTWSGVGIVGDAGAELVEREDGRMEVALKATPTYIGPKDIVYTAAETRAKMPFVNKEAISATGKPESFDYGKMAAAMKQKPSSTVVNIDKEFISESVANGLMKSRYFDRYYKSK